MVTSYFHNLFSDDSNREPLCIHGAFPSISEIDKRRLIRDVTRSEILDVVNHMGAFKAPGADGL